MNHAVKRTSIAISLILFTLLMVSATFAATAEPAWKFNRSFNTWTQALNAIETRFDNPDYITDHATEFRTRLLEIREQANEAGATANTLAADTQDLLNALGPRPEEGAPEEAAEVAQKRRKLEAEIADYRGRAAQAQLIVRRVDALTGGLNAIEQGQAVRTLLTRNPSPLSYITLAAAPAAIGEYLQRLTQAPIDWWQKTGSDGREKLTSPAIFLSALLLIIGAFGSRRALVHWVGRDETIAEPSYTRRLLGASAEALANGLLPALLAAILWFGANKALKLQAGEFLDLINAIVVATLIIIAAIALPRAALSPRLPNWRVTPIKPKYARRLSSRIGALGILFGIDIFIGFTAPTDDPAFLAIFSAIFTTLEAGFILDLLQPRLWRPDPDWQVSAKTQEKTEQTAGRTMNRRRLVWRALRLAVALIAIASALAAWIGYTALSVYLIDSLITSALIVGALFLLKALFTEWIGILMSQHQVIDWLNLSRTGSATVKFWLTGLLEASIYIAGAVLIGATWGLPLDNIWLLTYNLLTAIQVGGATISIADIFTAIFIFAVTLVVFRLGKQLLRETILPQTRLDIGAQYSISTVFGYVGIIAAIMLSASALGVQFQNLIIIAGALSVGIGFGLQNIANNFISGLILLFERPIRVGDLIEVGDTIGHVTHINVRRTEVETFQRAEIMIPNSQLVSASVINWTHSDRKGRIEVKVGVAYGSDTDLVRQCLLDAADAVTEVISFPTPKVMFIDFGASSLDFELRCFTDNISDRITIASALRFEIDRHFRKNNIEIPFPQRVLHFAPPHTDPTDGTMNKNNE